MRVILAGTRTFGKVALEMLLAQDHEVAGVWSPYDVEAVFDPPRDPLTVAAQRLDLWVPPVYRTPKSVSALEADLFVAAHSHDFIGRGSRAATRLGGIGYHPSLLPRHRGRDAVRWTIHMRDPVAGGSVYWLTDNVDGGPIARQDWCHVRPDDDASSLWKRELFPIGIHLLARVLEDLDRGVMWELPQDEAAATWEPSWDRPPLHRPELPQLGNPNGFEVVATKEEAMRRARESGP